MPPPRGLDWRRISRWCCLGTIVMLVWLAAPVVRCSWVAFKATPISEVETSSPGEADQQRLERGAGFFEKWGSAMNQCYARTPLLGQERWKTIALLGFGGAMVLAWLLNRLELRRRRTYGD